MVIKSKKFYGRPIYFVAGFVLFGIGQICSAGVVGPNQPLAHGVLGYQGFPMIAVSSLDPTKLVASAVSGEVPPPWNDPQCNVQSASGINITATVKLFGSADGGATWTARCAPWHPFVMGGVPHADSWFESAPSVAYNEQGIAVAAYVLSSQQTVQHPDDTVTKIVGSAIVLAKSTDNGSSWNPLSVVDNEFSVPNQTYSDTKIAIDTSNGIYSHYGRTYVIALHGTSAPSDPGLPIDGGIVIFESDQLSPGSWGVNKKYTQSAIAAAPSISVGPDGAVYAVWNLLDTTLDPSCEGDKSVLSRSIDGGITWTNPSVIDSHQYCSFGDGVEYNPKDLNPPAQYYRGGNAYVSLDIDRNPQSPSFGTIYAAFADYARPNAIATSYAVADTDIFLRHSTDGGATWSKRLRVNDDLVYNASCVTNCTSATQLLPTLAVDQSDGSVNIAWYDTRNFQQNIILQFSCSMCFLPAKNPSTEIYYARSVDGGVSVEKNIKVSDSGENFYNHITYSNELEFHWGHPVGNNPADDPMGHANQYGDYIGIVAANRQVHPVWTDTRNFVPDLDEDAGLFEDIATATVTNCAAPKWNGALNAVKVSGHINLSWNSISDWGTGATKGSFEVRRWDGKRDDASFKVLASGLPATTISYMDSADLVPGSHCYRVIATNNCSGTKMTPISLTSVMACVTTP